QVTDRTIYFISINYFSALPGRRTEVTLPILCSPQVGLDAQAPFGEESRKLLGFDPPRQLLTGLRKRGKELLGAAERLRPSEHISVDVGEEQPTALGRPRAPAQSHVDRGFREVVRHALPQDERPSRLTVASVGHGHLDAVLVEVTGHEPACDLLALLPFIHQF